MKKPNVVLIFADDLGYGDVSCFNEESKIKTRHIDNLAKEGMKFVDSHATSALCTPSRYGLLTGRYNWRSRLKSSVIPGDSQTLIEKDRETLAHLMKKRGYKTAAVGKWHLGLEWTMKEKKDYEKFSLNSKDFEEPEYQYGRDGNFDSGTPMPAIEGLDIDYEKPIQFGPNDYGFDYFFGTSASLDQPPYVYIENDRILGDPVVLTGLPKLDRATASQQQAWEQGPAVVDHIFRKVPEDMQNKVMELLDDFTKSDEPFFLYYPVHLVHGPIIPAPKFQGKSGIGPYGDFVLQLDHYVGEIVDKLKSEGVFEDTIVIFTSDNGASGVAGFEELAEYGHNPSYHFRGRKADIWEGGHREPAIVSYPKMIKAGSVSHQTVCHSDIYRTMADLLDITLPDEVAEDSHSILSIWKGEEEPVRKDIVHSSGNGGFSIRRDFWKLNLVSNGGGFGSALISGPNGAAFQDEFKPYELFDLRDDIEEKNNVIEKYPEVVKELTEVLAKYIKDGRSTEGKPQENQPNYPTGNWRQLEWMDGYEEYVEKLNKNMKK